MTARTALLSALEALEAARVPFMLTGSFASSLYGNARATQDLDLVISGNREQVRQLVRGLVARGFYVDEESALHAFSRRSQFNAIELATGWKIDLIVQKDRPFSVLEFERRIAVDFEGTEVSVATPEDVVLSKLEWAKLGGSARQLEDVAAILRSGEGTLDQSYLDRWVEQLELADQWRSARQLAFGEPG
jgi:hypothetical protein